MILTLKILFHTEESVLRVGTRLGLTWTRVFFRLSDRIVIGIGFSRQSLGRSSGPVDSQVIR